MPLVILKATEKCNSNCSYCDVVRKDGTGRTMPLDTLDTVFKRVNEYLLQFPEEKIELNWHGGEPLMLGTDYFREAIKLQEKNFQETFPRIKNTIQTNLTLMSEEFIAIFKQMGINYIGTSFDPQPNVRGPGEGLDSDHYNKQFMKGIGILKRHGIGWGVIYVATRKALESPLDVFYFLTNLVPRTGSILMNPVLFYDESRKDERITAEEWTEFLGKIFPVWWKNRQRYPVVNPFQGYLDKVVTDPENKFPSHVAGCVWNEVNISPGGETFQCGRASDWDLLSFGNISDRPLVEILKDTERQQLEDRLINLENGECKGCRFWGLCSGGCPLDAWSEHGDFMHRSPWCESTRGFIEKYFEPITGLRFGENEHGSADR